MSELDEYKTRLEDIDITAKKSSGDGGLASKIIEILKKYKCNVIIAGAVLLFLLFFKPKFIMNVKTGKNNAQMRSLNIASLFKWWIILTIVLSIGLIIYNKFCKKGKTCNVCKG